MNVLQRQEKEVIFGQILCVFFLYYKEEKPFRTNVYIFSLGSTNYRLLVIGLKDEKTWLTTFFFIF